MKRITLMTVAAVMAYSGFAQKDSTYTEAKDTIKVGNFVIIKKRNSGNTDNHESKKSIDDRIEVVINKMNKSKHAQKSNISTNWWIFDLGFANYRDETNYTNAQTMGFLKQVGSSTPVNGNTMTLNTGKSSNVNIWVFMQKLNLTANVINLKYGLGLEMYNFRFDSRLSYRKDPVPYVFNDTIGFTKNKLYAGYVTVPVMLNINFTPERRNGLSLSAGVSAGYLLGSHSKQISAERGKEKYRSTFNLNPWRFAAVGELGLGPVRLYGSYSFNKLHKDFTGIEQYPYTVGVRFSNW